MLSVCIITKNEAKKLTRCIESLETYPLEIVVVDTGSTDNTIPMLVEKQKELQKECKPAILKIEYFKWENDFAAAKNKAIEYATNEMVLVLDSDEYLEEIDFPVLEKMLEKNKNLVGRILRKNEVQENGQILYKVERLNRLFSKKLFHYEGKIHEQVVTFLGDEYETYEVPIQIYHDGYAGTAEEKAKKAKRNIELLEKELEEKGPDPYLYYQLGSGYYMAGEYEKAVTCFAEGLSFDLNPKLEYVINMVETYGYALIKAGRAEDALMFENIQNEFGDTADFHILMGFIYMNNEMFSQAVQAFLRATDYVHYMTEGANSFLAFYNAGVVEECLGHLEEAANLYEKSGQYEPAVRRLKLLKES